MRELRTQENDKFEKYFEIVRNAAKKKGCIYFVDCGEGRELFTDELEGEDLSGWLIPKEKADMFEKEFQSKDVSEKWNSYVCFAIWSNTDKGVEIEFRNF
jgi:hypothetical protein